MFDDDECSPDARESRRPDPAWHVQSSPETFGRAGLVLQMRRAGLSLSAIAVVAVAMSVLVGATLAVAIVAPAGIVGMIFVAIWQWAGARHTYSSSLDQCSLADQKRVRKALSNPEKVTSLPRRLREVTQATARQRLHTAAAFLPWWVSCVVTFAGDAAWQAFESPSRGSPLNLLTAGIQVVAAAAYCYQARKGRAVLAGLATDPGLPEP